MLKIVVRRRFKSLGEEVYELEVLGIRFENETVVCAAAFLARATVLKFVGKLDTGLLGAHFPQRFSGGRIQNKADK